MCSAFAGPGCLGILYEPKFRRIDHLFNHVNLVFGSFYQDFSVLTTMFSTYSILCEHPHVKPRDYTRLYFAPPQTALFCKCVRDVLTPRKRREDIDNTLRVFATLR